jgi:hypothetical protein
MTPPLVFWAGVNTLEQKEDLDLSLIRQGGGRAADCRRRHHAADNDIIVTMYNNVLIDMGERQDGWAEQKRKDRDAAKPTIIYCWWCWTYNWTNDVEPTQPKRLWGCESEGRFWRTPEERSFWKKIRVKFGKYNPSIWPCVISGRLVWAKLDWSPPSSSGIVEIFLGLLFE